MRTLSYNEWDGFSSVIREIPNMHWQLYWCHKYVKRSSHTQQTFLNSYLAYPQSLVQTATLSRTRVTNWTARDFTPLPFLLILPPSHILANNHSAPVISQKFHDKLYQVISKMIKSCARNTSLPVWPTPMGGSPDAAPLPAAVHSRLMRMLKPLKQRPMASKQGPMKVPSRIS